MFDQIKQMQEMKRIQDAMKTERETVQKKGITVTVNGTLAVERITLNPTLSQAEAEHAIAECVNEAQKNIQKRMAKSMQGMLGGLG